MSKAEIGKRYRHYKNGEEYVVTGFAVHTETNEELVIYEGQYHDEVFGEHPVWARPRKMWEERLKYKGEFIDRFNLLNVDVSQ